MRTLVTNRRRRGDTVTVSLLALGLRVSARMRVAFRPRRGGVVSGALGCAVLAMALGTGCSSGGGSGPGGAGTGTGAVGGTGAAGGTGGIASSTGGSPKGGATGGEPGTGGGAVGSGGSSGGEVDGGVGDVRGGSDGGAGAGSGGPIGGTTGRGAGGATGSGGADAGSIDGGAGTPTDASTVGKFTVYIAGDSTVSQYVLDPANPKSWAGWGQMLQPHYDSKVVTVLDKAVGGMTARHFILGGNLAAILNVIKEGDYLLVQFGTNDSNASPGVVFTINGVTYPYFADANTDFKTYLQQYIDGARAKHAIPVLVTPPPRNSAYCGGGRSLANYGQAMIDLGAADKVPVIDLGLATWTYLNKICPKPTSGTTETFFKVTGTVIDGTHFQENGARVMAGFVADGVGELGLGLDAFRIN